MIEAVDVLPAASTMRQASIDLVLAELKSPDQVEQAGLLARSTDDTQLQANCCCARPISRCAFQRAVGSRHCWTLYAHRQLPADRFDWLSNACRAAREYGR